MMNTTHTGDQLAQGREAWLYMARYQSQHGALPPNWSDFLDLPLEVKNPETEEIHITLIRNLTAADIQHWAQNYEIEITAQYLADIQGDQ